MKYRTVVFYKNYFEDFFLKQKKKVRDKILWTLTLIEDHERIPDTYFKHLKGTDGLYEIRVKSGRDIFRIFSFFDNDKLVVAINSFQKKSTKTPRKEIEKALKIKEEYESEKE